MCTVLLLLGVSASAQYLVEWKPDPNTVYGDPLEISPQGQESFVTIGEDLNMDEFNVEDAAFCINNGAWHRAYVIPNGAIGKYQAELRGEGFFALEEFNHVEFRIWEYSNNGYFITGADYFYAKPQLAFQSVQGEPYNNSTALVIDENETFTMILDAWAKEFGTNKNCRAGDKRIKALEYSLLPDFSDSEIQQAAASANRVEFVILDIFNVFQMGVDINYGFNTLYFRAIGEGDDYSETQELMFFIFDFEYSQTTFCKYDHNYPLTGKPFGGVFSGECVVGNTNSFNPSLAGNSASTSVTYTYTLNGETFQKTKDIDLLKLPDFIIQGPAQVCGFEHGAIYNVSGDDDITATWSVNEDAVINQIPISSKSLFVDWGEMGTGFIDAEVTNSYGCTLEKRKIVDIGVLKAPADSAYVILNDRMLVCSDTDVSYYYWYRAGNDEFLNMTTTNYYALNFQPSQADSFYVLTAYNTLGCVTHSHYSEPELHSKMSSADYYLALNPNPTKGKVSIFIPESHNNLELIVKGADGTVFRSYEITGSTHGYYRSFNLESLENGIYFIIIKGDSIYKFRKVIIAK